MVNYPFLFPLFITHLTANCPHSAVQEAGAQQLGWFSSGCRTQGSVGLRAGVVSALRTRPTQRGSWLRSAGKFRTNVTAWAWGRSGCHDTLRIHRLESRRGRSKALSVVVIFHQPRHGLPRINNCQSMVWNVSPSLCKIRAPLVLLLQAFRLSLQR